MATDYAAEFANLGGTIDRRWRQTSYHPDAFPSIAADAAAMVGSVDLDDLLIREHSRLELAYRFSDFDLQLYSTDRFRIEFLYWVGSDTSIHHHGFSGAFKLACGRSLHTEYDFEIRHTLHPELLVGELRLRSSKVFEPGEICLVQGGRRFIHANFHMMRPTVTMLIRTLGDQCYNPLLRYRHPHFAVSQLDHRPRMDQCRRRSRVVEIAARSGRWEFLQRVIDELWPNPTLEDSLEILQLPAIKQDPDRLGRALARAAERHPTFAAEITATTREELRSERGEALRRRLVNADGKFLLAVLINVPDADAILDHLAAEFPDEAPCAAAARLLARMAADGHLPRFHESEMANLVAVLEGNLRPEEAPALTALLGEDLLRPLLPGAAASVGRAAPPRASRQISRVADTTAIRR